MALSEIVSLEQLSLRVGCSTRMRCNWLIDHDKLRHHLKGLNRLKMLALLRDTFYRLGLEHVIPAQYYDVRITIGSDYDDAAARPHLDVDEDIEMEVDENFDEHCWLEPGELMENHSGININRFEYVVDEHSTIWGVRGQWVETDKRIWGKGLIETACSRKLRHTLKFSQRWHGSTVGSGRWGFVLVLVRMVFVMRQFPSARREMSAGLFF